MAVGERCLVNQEEIMQQLQAAVQAYQGKDLNSAEAIFKQILATNPKEPNALHLLGCIHKDRGKAQQAVELIQASIQVDGSNPIPFLNLGKILSIAGQHENAAGVFQESLKRNQQIPETWFCFANALKEMEKVEEAKQAYRNALQLNPAHAGAASNLGALLNNEGELEEAEQLFSKAVEQSPNDVNLRINYGMLLAEKNEHAAAIVQYQIALPLAPRSPELHYNFASALKVEGEVEEAIASFRKAIEVKPDFADAYLNLGNALNEEGEVEEARQVVTKFRHAKSLEDEALLAIKDKTLVFDWHHRRAMSLFWQVELASSQVKSTSLASVKQVEALCFPPLFLGHQIARAEGKRLYEKGFVVDEGLVSSGLCDQLISQFNNEKAPMSHGLIESVVVNGVLRTALERILFHAGFPHLIWNCIFFSKGPEDEAVSDAWHYDNHYNSWTPKLMVYLNSQSEECGATHFVDANLSKKISERSDYMGLVHQREAYGNLVKPFVEELNLDPVSLDPQHYVFSPESAGSGVWFCPARALHRGVSPVKGVRHVLSFSLTPLPADCGWSVDQCVEKSVDILKDKIKKGMQKTDDNPYWISSDVGSD